MPPPGHRRPRFQQSFPPSSPFTQPGWAGPPPQPPESGNTVKWLLAGIGVLLIVAIAVGVTVLVTRGSSGIDAQPTTSIASDPAIASAADDGPIEIVTLEPTCQGWTPLSRALNQVQKNGWGDRDASIPASSWDAKQRENAEAVAKTMRDTANQAVVLAQETPHRVIRELYEQLIAYGRAYADSLASYTPRDDNLALANIAAASSIDFICNSITYGSAAARAASVPGEPVAADPASINPEDPMPVISSFEPSCSGLIAARDTFVNGTAEWVKIDSNLSSVDWTPDQRILAERTAEALNETADKMQSAGSGESDATVHDLSTLASIYMRGYSSALATYDPNDSDLFMIASRITNLLLTACWAVV